MSAGPALRARIAAERRTRRKAAEVAVDDGYVLRPMRLCRGMRLDGWTNGKVPCKQTTSSRSGLCARCAGEERKS